MKKTSSDVEVRLYSIAHGRTGDKGDVCNISVIAYDARLYEYIREQVTVGVVQEIFAHRKPSRTIRYELPLLSALNFVIEGVLDGGVNDSLNLDSHGKSLSFYLMDVPLTIPGHLARLASDESVG